MQRKVRFLQSCEEGKTADHVAVTSRVVTLPSHHFFLLSFSRTGSQIYDVKLFPEEPVELLVGEALTLNCTAMVEFNAGVDIQWSYPGKQVLTRLISHQEFNASARLSLFLLTRQTAA